jgi:hypothetical protein
MDFNFTRATYNVNEETVTVNGNTFEHGKYWHSTICVDDTNGWWDNDHNRFIPDGFYEWEDTGWINRPTDGND